MTELVSTLFPPALYLLAATFCVGASGATPAQRAPIEKRVWRGLAYVLVLLASLRITNLQVFLLEGLRHLARSFHVFEHRRIVQALLLAGCVVLGLLIVTIGSTARKMGRLTTLAMGALLLLALLVLARGMSFHLADMILERELVGFRLVRLLETTLLCVACAAALTYALQERRSKRD
jgi:hypothetical protein